MTSWGGKTATYDAFGRIRHIDTAAGGIDFTYDFSGRLIIQDGAGGRRVFPSTYEESDSSGSWNVAYLGPTRLARFRSETKAAVGCDATATAPALALIALGGLALIARRTRRAGKFAASAVVLSLWAGCNCGHEDPTELTKVEFFHHDGIGSTNFVTDEAGKPSAMTAYAPFGKTLTDIGQSHLFTGRYTDQSLELTFWSQRALALSLGRWNLPDVDALEKPEDHLLSPQGLNPYVYAANNPVNFTDAKGAFEEPVHGALTYHLAMKAGFTESEAAQIALSCAGVDHNPKTAPTAGLFGMISNLWTGVTENYHFADPPDALARVNGEIDRGSKMDLNQLGVALHTLEDVGFTNALGPHMRGTPADGAITLAANGHRGGHPTFRLQDGSLSEWDEHFADQPFRDETRNIDELNQIYETLSRAAQARHPGAKSDDAGARALIGEVVRIRTASGITEFLQRRPVDTSGRTGERSYDNQVQLNYATKGSMAKGVAWKKEDSSVGE